MEISTYRIGAYALASTSGGVAANLADLTGWDVEALGQIKKAPDYDAKRHRDDEQNYHKEVGEYYEPHAQSSGELTPRRIVSISRELREIEAIERRDPSLATFAHVVLGVGADRAKDPYACK
jgi:hypothetical protein